MMGAMVTKKELFLRVERLKAWRAASNDRQEREVLVRLICALLELANTVHPDLPGEVRSSGSC